MSIIQNERTKYVANSFDRASTSCLTVGVFAPIAAALYTSAGTQAGAPQFIGAVLSWLFAAAIFTSVWKERSQEASMTSLQIFAFYVLPLCIAAGGALYAYLWTRNFDRKHGKPPRD